MASLFSIPIDQLKGVGPRRAERFCRLGVPSVGALLQLLPARVPRLEPSGRHRGHLARRRLRRLRDGAARADGAPHPQGVTLYKCTSPTTPAPAEVTLFNNPYGAQLLKAGELYYFRGRVAAFGSPADAERAGFCPGGRGRRD